MNIVHGLLLMEGEGVLRVKTVFLPHFFKKVWEKPAEPFVPRTSTPISPTFGRPQKSAKGPAAPIGLRISTPRWLIEPELPRYTQSDSWFYLTPARQKHYKPIAKPRKNPLISCCSSRSRYLFWAPFRWAEDSQNRLFERSEFRFWPGANLETVKINSAALIFYLLLHQGKRRDRKKDKKTRLRLTQSIKLNK